MKDRTLIEKIEELINVLQLKPNRKGMYLTEWGYKTKEGLVETIKAILELRD